jgi:parallel beta-helix repeat protein
MRTAPALSPAGRICRVELLECRRLLTTYYVSTTGSDTGAGSSAAPFRTIQHAADLVGAGDTVIVRAGSYAGFILGWDSPTAGTSSAPIVFKADPNAAAGSVIINAASPHTHNGIDLEPGCDWITIQGFTVTGAGGNGTLAVYPSRGYGIKVTGNHDQVIGNTIHDLDYAVAGIHDNGGNNVLIQGNTIYALHNHDNGDLGHGIYVADADGAIVRGNVIHNNDYIGIHLNGDPNLVSNALIAGNRIYDNGQNGINCDGLVNSRVENNVIWGFESFGICLFQIDASAPSTGNVIVNNTIVSTASGAGAAIRMLNGATGNTIFNNILLGGGGVTIRVSDDSMSGLFSDRNVVGSLFESEDSGQDQTLAQWRSSSGQDAHSFTATTIQLFQDATNHDWHLKITSPAVNTGVASLNGKAAPTTDFDGVSRPRGAAFDLGAFEFVQPIDYAGGDTTTARRVGVINIGQVRAFEDYIGAIDRNDYYRFDVATALRINVKLYNMTDNGELQLFNSAGVRLAYCHNAGLAVETFAMNLARGTYYLRVLYLGTAGTNYRLRLEATAPAPASAPRRPVVRGMLTLGDARTDDPTVLPR